MRLITIVGGLMICLPLCSCSSKNEQAPFFVNRIIDVFDNKTVKPTDNYYSLSLYDAYKIEICINKESYGEWKKTLQNQLTFTCEKTSVRVDTYSRTYVDDGDYLFVTYDFEIINNCENEPLKINCLSIAGYSFSSTIYLTSNAAGKNYGISNVESINEYEEFLNSMRFYEFQNKKRIDVIKDPDMPKYERLKVPRYYFGIKTDSVDCYLYDSIYLPPTYENNNYIYYRDKIYEPEDSPEAYAQYALEFSDQTGPYPIAHYRNENNNYSFDCYHRRAVMTEANFFATHSDCFKVATINGVDYYFWNDYGVKIPFDCLTKNIGATNVFFASGDYLYFVQFYK